LRHRAGTAYPLQATVSTYAGSALPLLFRIHVIIIMFPAGKDPTDLISDLITILRPRHTELKGLCTASCSEGRLRYPDAGPCFDSS